MTARRHEPANVGSGSAAAEARSISDSAPVELASGVLCIQATSLGTVRGADNFLVRTRFLHGRHSPPGCVLVPERFGQNAAHHADVMTYGIAV